ncbi:MAG: MFS transporter [Candidatus Velthaea sp.]
MGPRVISSDVPFRLDRLPWSRWHWSVVVGLGITWVLDGLEVTIVGNVAPTLKTANGLGLHDVQFTAAASTYLVGAAAGALFFGYLTDKFGRKKLFLITLGMYLALTIATAFSWNFTSFLVFRFLTGFGLGGEYAAINSAIDELIPSRHRGTVDLAINGTWWLGTILGSLAALVLLDPHLVDQRYGWRLAFGSGALLAVAVLFVRNSVPESPRWLLTHGKPDEAHTIVDEIETRIRRDHARELPATGDRRIAIDTAHRATLASIFTAMWRDYRTRALVALTLMSTQAFIYNAFTFTQGLVLGTFFHVPDSAIPAYYLAFAVGNLAGPLLLGRLFDVVGRRPLIAGTYILSGLLLLGTGLLFIAGKLDAVTITLCWTIVFFFASAGASAAYLTASEIFPLEARALAIAIVFAVGTLVGGAVAPSLFGALIASNDPLRVCYGYAFAAALMIAGGTVAALFGVDAEGKSLEDIALPLSSR